MTKFSSFERDYIGRDQTNMAFFILSQGKEVIYPSDFLPLLKSSIFVYSVILENHAGLEFLKSTPEFQERYSETVSYRIFFGLDKTNTGYITWREFKQSKFLEVLFHLEDESDINKVRDYFSYEHFYVIYIKFWELDNDHDFIISKEEFTKYAGHGLSTKVVDRIFEGVPIKLKHKNSGFMGFEDFLYFILCEEDKKNPKRSGFEMEYFFEEQSQRLDYLQQEPVFYNDFLCQMIDMFKPEEGVMFRKDHFLKFPQYAAIFFDILTNLNKFVEYEQRDPFRIRQEIVENPGFSDWDLFASNEYTRMSREEANNEYNDMLDDNEWDYEQDLSFEDKK